LISKKSYTRFFLLTGFLSLLTVLFLLAWKKATSDWLIFFLWLVLPTFLTLASYLYILKYNTKKDWKLPFGTGLATKVTCIALSTALLLFQLFIIVGCIFSVTDRHFPSALFFYGYFMLVGLVCNFTFLYHISGPDFSRDKV
jgi:hypothetical protein